jgi:H(+)-transporting ATP synthase subunit D
MKLNSQLLSVQVPCTYILSTTNYANAIQLLVELASLQTSFVTLDEVIKTTNRRVNAIEHVIIPKIERTLAYIISELGMTDIKTTTDLLFVVVLKRGVQNNNKHC